MGMQFPQSGDAVLQSIEDWRSRGVAGFLLHPSLMREWLDALENRTKEFAKRVLKLSSQLDKLDVPKSVIWQMVDAGTSVAANHRACRRARSTRELVAKLGIVLEEADESNLWLDLTQSVVNERRVLQELRELEREAAELTAIFNASISTSRKKLPPPRRPGGP